jgi:tetratricopeptide (TPR) repeat protein
LSSGHALADDAPAQASQAASAEVNSDAPPDAAAASPEQAAAIAYQKALLSYSKGDLAGALDHMRTSYQLSKRAELLYNLAQLEEELKACSDALADYRRYLELVPHGRYRHAAEDARVRLEHECPPLPAASAPPLAIPADPKLTANDAESTQAAAKPEPNPYWTAPRVIGWSAIATGTLAEAGALYFQLEAIQAKNEFQHSVDDAENGGPPADHSLQDRQHHTNHLAIAFAVTGGALIAGGALLLLLDPGNNAQRSSSARLYAVPGLVGACYAQSF